MKLYEFQKYFDIAIWMCGAEGKQDSLSTVCFLADQTITMAAKAPYVKRDSHGLPTVLPPRGDGSLYPDTAIDL